MASADDIIDDLRAESDSLDALVATLPDEDWERATPAPGWTIAHQIALELYYWEELDAHQIAEALIRGGAEGAIAQSA